MRKRIGLALLVLMVATGAVLADSQTYTDSVLSTADVGVAVWHRLYTPVFGTISPGGDTNCVANTSLIGFDPATRACQSKFVTPKTGSTGYRAYLDDILNDTGNQGNVHYAVWDVETNVGAANHTGFYFFAGKVVNTGDVSTWNNTDCSGTAAQTCLGQGNPTNAAGTNVDNTPLGSIAPVQGFRPMPVPTVSSTNKATGDINLAWRAATDLNGLGTVSYDVYGVKKASCTAPLASEYTTLLRNVAGTSATFNTQTDFGTAPTVSQCYYFAIKLSYPAASSTAVKSLFFSANSQGVAFGGAASTVTNIKAVRTGNAIAVSWNTSLEDGLKGFYVMRSFTENGTYERVSGLIAAKGQPSSYTFVDTKAPMGQVRGTGVYYKVQTSDIDNNVQAYGPVKAELGMGQGPVQREQRQQIRENKTQRTR